MTYISPLDAWSLYGSAFADEDVAVRRAALERAWADDGVLVDASAPDGVVGRDAVLAHLAKVKESLPPGTSLRGSGKPEVLGGRMRARWVVDGLEGAAGTDFVEFAADGRISRVTVFSD